MTHDPKTQVPLDPIERNRLDNEHIRILLAFALTSQSNCVDIGAAEGTILRQMIQQAPKGRHVAFEPLPVFFQQLQSQFPNADLRNVALSNKPGEAEYQFVRTDPTYSGFKRRTYNEGPQEIETITVKVETLDRALPKRYEPALIKIDVEGAEREVIEGGMSVIKKHKPIIVFEHGLGAANHYGSTPHDIFRLLNGEAGLRIYDMDGGGPYSASEFEEIYEANLFWNFVARP